MHIAMLVAEFHLHGCRSLKEKRRRLSGLRERFGRQTNLAVSETDFQDDLLRSQWAFVAISSNRRMVDKVLSGVEEHLDTEVDAVLIASQREEL